MEKEKSAGAVVFRKDKETKYLLLHYEAGHWDFPKGHIEANETDEDTIKRETEEETGLKDIRLISKDVIFYLAETKKAKIKLSFEHIGYKWLPFKQTLEKLTFKNAKDILKKADSFLKKNPRLSEFY